MITLKENEHYKLVDVRINSHRSGSYQILELINKCWEVHWIYTDKVVATWYFNRLSEGKGVTW